MTPTAPEPVMPLLDHFHPPLSRPHPWRGFHGAWAAAMARLLNTGVLPPGYYAVPFLDRDGEDDLDVVRVEVRTDDGDPQLAAAIELVSPRNKDRPRAREALAAKCADHLRRGCGLVVVVVVTTRRADLRGGLFAALGVEPPDEGPGVLSAVSYRPVEHDGEGQLLAWPEQLEIGRPLPTLPLWLGADASVPLNLEASYRTACEDLLIRLAG